MSRWLNSVNTILDKLDDKVDNLAGDAVQNIANSAKKIILRNDSFDSYDSNEEEYYSDDDNNDSGSIGGQQDDKVQQPYEDDAVNEKAPPRKTEEEEEDQDELIPVSDDPNKGSTSSSEEHSSFENIELPSTTNVLLEEDNHPTIPQVIGHTTNDCKNDDAVQKERQIMDKDSSQKAPPPPRPSTQQPTPSTKQAPVQPTTTATPIATTTSSSSSNTNYKRELQLLKKQHAKELQQLGAQKQQLQAELDATTQELRAVQIEVSQASDMVVAERRKLHLEKEDLLEEQEDELQEVRDQYESQLAALRQQLQQQHNDFQSQLQTTVRQHKQTGGTLQSELNETLQREQSTLETVEHLSSVVEQLESEKANFIATVQNLEQKNQTLVDTKVALQQQAVDIEEKLDTAQQSHQHQLQVRLARETELERTIAKLSQSVVATTPQPPPNTVQVSQLQSQIQTLQQQLQTVTLDHESCTTELSHAQVKNKSLQEQVTQLAAEHASETQHWQSQCRDLRGQLDQWQQQSRNSSNTDKHQAVVLQTQLAETQSQLSHVTEQLFKAQHTVETKHSQVLALEGRLQSARQKANDTATATTLYNNNDDNDHHRMELGSPRRKKNHKSIRSALGLRSVRGRYGSRGQKFQHVVGNLLDSLDAACTEFIHSIRVEPMLRLGVLLYLSVLHLWCFGLVVYHTVQSETHGDLGTLTDHSRLKGVMPHHIVPHQP